MSETFTEKTAPERVTFGQVYWEAYAAHDVAYVAEVKFTELHGSVREAIEAGAQAVADTAIRRRIDELDAQAASPDDEYRLTAVGEARAEAEAVRYALVEQMGHRATVASVREVTFCGTPMLEVTDLKTGSVHLVSPQSIYEITWLTEDQARARAKPWTATAITTGHPQDAEGDPWGPPPFAPLTPEEAALDAEGEDDGYRQAGIDATPEMHESGKERDYDAEGNEL